MISMITSPLGILSIIFLISFIAFLVTKNPRKKEMFGMGMVLTLGMYLLLIVIVLGTFPQPIKIRRFKSEQHIEAITSAFRFHLLPEETLSVTNYTPSFMQASARLNIVVEGIKSEESLLSRLNGDYERWHDNEITRYEREAPHWWQSGTFSAYSIALDGRDIDSTGFGCTMLLFHSKGAISAELSIAGERYTQEFRDVLGILNTHYPLGVKKWLNPVFSVPAIVEIALIVFLNRRKAGKCFHEKAR
ncbi:MAG: hypothetical protein FWG87_01010 [Defluviitaleaceae bacterium]|nr:hypothetical protein [Defluviitaleaceae bacterium]